MNHTGPDHTGPVRDGIAGTELFGMLQIARYHRQHERYHSMMGLDEAVVLRRDSNALKVLADRLLDTSRSGQVGPPLPAGPAWAAAGCADLNDPAAVATTGILFMEGEREPAELAGLKAKLAAQAATLERTGRWLAEKMDSAWKRESALLTPELVTVACRRLMALTRTSMAGNSLAIAARLLTAAHRALSSQDFSPAGVRADRAVAGRLLLSVSWLLDTAAAVLAEQGAVLGMSDPDWTAYVDALQELVDDPDAQPQAGRGAAT